MGGRDIAFKRDGRGALRLGKGALLLGRRVTYGQKEALRLGRGDPELRQWEHCVWEGVGLRFGKGAWQLGWGALPLRGGGMSFGRGDVTFGQW